MTQNKPDHFFRKLVIGAPLCTLLFTGALVGCAPKPETFAVTQEETAEEDWPRPKRRWPPEPDDLPIGWSDTNTKGIYWKWCDPEDRCNTSSVIGDNGYVQALVWCKERACGDIYGRVNLIDTNGTVVGWTNDSGYGGAGQKVQLTFDSYQDFSKASLTELKFRG